MLMRFFLTALIFISTSLFADNHRCEDRGNDPEICDLFDEVSDTFQEEILEVLVVGGVLIAVTAYAIAEGTSKNEDIKYDFLTNKIIFSTGSKLDNLEINFSSQISQDFFPKNNLHSSDNLYLGFKYRF